MEEVNNEDVKDVKGKKAKVIERLKAKRPELNEEDEESLYSAINDDYDVNEGELANYRNNEKSIVDIFESDPRMAGMFAEMANKGMSPLEYLISNYGEEFREALDDPEKASKLVEAQNAYTTKITTNKKLEEESKANLQESLAALEAAKTEVGANDEEESKAFELFCNILDDGIKDKVSKETWVMFLKGIRHDADVEQATIEGQVKGKNEKIGALKVKQTVPQGLPPQLSGQGTPVKSSNKKSFGGVLDKYGDDYRRWDED